MKDQINTIRDAAWVLREHNLLHFGGNHNTIAEVDKITDALSQLEAMVGEQKRQTGGIPESVIDAYLEDYEMRGEDVEGRDACHTPSRREKMLIKDAIMGLLSEVPAKQPQDVESQKSANQALNESCVSGVRVEQPQAEAVPSEAAIKTAWERVTLEPCTHFEAFRRGALWAAPQQAEAVSSDVEVIRKALERAFIMGQKYWVDADSESYIANKRSDVTRQKFNAMRDEVCAAIAQQKGQP